MIKRDNDFFFLDGVSVLPKVPDFESHLRLKNLLDSLPRFENLIFLSNIFLFHVSKTPFQVNAFMYTPQLVQESDKEFALATLVISALLGSGLGSIFSVACIRIL